MSTSNLPSWPGADSCYQRAYALLAEWGRSGEVAITRRHNGKPVRCTPSERIDDLIDALNRGDEERIKATLLYPDYSRSTTLLHRQKGA